MSFFQSREEKEKTTNNKGTGNREKELFGGVSWHVLSAALTKLTLLC